MDLKQLAALVAVHETGGFSAAARALYTVQSNVSSHVSRLEKELGATLVDRTSGALTEEGLAVVGRARRIQDELEAIVSDVASLGDEITGNARIGVIGTVGRWLVPRLVDAVHREHPGVRMVVLDATTTSLLPMVESHEIDFAIVNIPVLNVELLTESLFSEDRVLVTPIDHPLAECDSVELATLADYELLLPPAGTLFRDELDDAATRIGVELKSKAEVDGMRLLASLAFQGFGAAVIPSGAAPAWVGGEWTVAAIQGLEPRSVGIVRRRKGRLSMAAEAVRHQVHEVVASQLEQRAGIHPVTELPAKKHSG